ncbi:MAG: DUF6049 family protein [Acidimicrobiia bacterium]
MVARLIIALLIIGGVVGAVPTGWGPAVPRAGAHQEAADAVGSGTAGLELVRQDPWIDPRGTFTFDIRTETPEAGYTLEARLLQAVDTVPEVLAGTDAIADARSIGRIRFPDPEQPEAGNVLPSLELDRGVVTSTVEVPVVPVADGTFGDPFVLDPGVFPVLVQLYDPDGNEVGSLATHLVHRSVALDDDPAPVTVLVDARTPIARDGDGRAVNEAEELQALERRFDALATFKTLPLALRLQPETVAALVENRATADAGAALAALNRLAGNGAVGSVEVLPATFVGFDEADWLADGASDLFRSELERGVRTLDANALRRPDRLAALEGRGEPSVQGRLFELGYRNIVQPAGDAAVQFGEGPYLVAELPDQRVLPAPGSVLRPVNGDGVGTGDGDGEELTVLDAHRLLAALMIAPLDGDQATQQLRLATAVDPAGPFATTLLSALSRPRGPLVATSLSDAFGDDDRLSRPRSWNVGDPATSGATAGAAARVAATISSVAGMHTMLGDPAALAAIEARLLLLPAAGLEPATVDRLYAGIADEVRAVRGAVVLPPDQSFTVTSHRTSLPLVLRNEGDRPLQVLLRLRSGELEFTGDNPALVTLEPGVNDLDIPIRTRRSGELEFAIDVTSPDGNLVVGTVDVRVLSRAISGVGVLLSGGALVFLVVWWIRNARRRRAIKREQTAAARRASATNGAPAASDEGAGHQQAPPAATEPEPEPEPEPDAATDAVEVAEPSRNGRHARSPGPPGRR